MTQWIDSESLIDLIRSRHHEGFTGLITGLTDLQHSFQIGFSQGDIILMSYRVLKGERALAKVAEIVRAKVTEHPTVKIPRIVNVLPATSSILQQLTAKSNFTEYQNSGMTAAEDITDQEITIPQSSSSTPRNRDLVKKITNSAIHHFGPIGAMVCEEKMMNFDPAINSTRTLLKEISREVGADEHDSNAFYDAVMSED